MKAGSEFSGKFQIGANADQSLDVSLTAMDAATLEVGTNQSASGATVDEVALVKGDGDEITDVNIDVTDYSSDEDLEIKMIATDVSSGEATFEIKKDGQTYKATAVTTDKGDGSADSKYTLANNINGLENVFKAGDSITITIAEDLTDTDEFNIKIGGATPKEVKGIDVEGGHIQAKDAITKIQAAIESVSEERSKIGAWSNRLDHTINNLGTSSENLTAAESRIRDVDYALAA